MRARGYTVDGAGASAGVDVFDDDPAPSGQQEQAETLWSTTMTWNDIGEGWYGGDDTAFADPEWTEDGTAFRIWYINYHAPSRKLGFMHNGAGGRIADPGSLSLHVGGYTVEPGDAMTAFARVRAATVSDIGSHWTPGEDIAIRLVRRTGETVETPAGPGLSVADAQVNESEGVPLRFVVRLGERSDTAVTVRYATSDGSATAGEDYTAARGVVRFAPGQTERTIEVEVLEDLHDEGSETMTLTLSRAFGATLGDAVAVGTITNTDPMPKAWLARFGRTVAEQAIEAVRGRFDARREAGLAGTLAGAPLGGGAEGGALAHRDEDAGRGLGTLAGWLRGEGEEEGEDEDGARGFGERTMSPGEAARKLVVLAHARYGGDRLRLVLGPGGGDALRRARRHARRRRRRRGVERDAGGGLVARCAACGADGLALAWRGRVPGRRRSGHGGVDADRALPLRALRALGAPLGVGDDGLRRGDVRRTRRIVPTLDGGRNARGTVVASPGHGLPDGCGGRALGVLVDGGGGGGAGGATLAAKGDAFAVRAGTGAVSGPGGNLNATRADVTRVRFALEGSRPFALGGTAALTPSLGAWGAPRRGRRGDRLRGGHRGGACARRPRAGPERGGPRPGAPDPRGGGHARAGLLRHAVLRPDARLGAGGSA